jgi:hypothetical protein
MAEIAISLISNYLPMVEQPFLSEPLLGNFLLHQVVIVVGWMVGALPYVPLFIAFSLIATDPAQTIASVPDGDLDQEVHSDDSRISPAQLD